MDSDSEKENYFSLYMKKRNKDLKKKNDFQIDKKYKNQCASSQKIKQPKLLLESSEKKKKNTFSFMKSYILNFKDDKKYKNKNRHSMRNKNSINEKQKIKNEKFNKSSNNIKKYAKSSPKKDYDIISIESKNNEINDNEMHIYNNNKIEKLKNRIFNLMNIIDTFEKKYVYNPQFNQIKEQFNKINMKKVPSNGNYDLNNMNYYNNNFNNIFSKTSKNSDINDVYFNENFSKTERPNYDIRKKFNEMNMNNKLKNKKCNETRQLSAVNPKFSEKNMAIIMLSRKKESKKLGTNSTFLKLISSNLIAKNELKKSNSNFTKNKSKSLVNKRKINSNSSSNKTLYKNENIEEKGEKNQNPNVFKRRINYSNFINQKMKQNITIHRNKGNYLKQSMMNKTKLGNKSNGCNSCLDMNNDNYVNDLLNKNNKSKSIDKNKLTNITSVNNINPINI